MSMTSLAKRLKLSVVAVTQSVERGERLREEKLIIFHESENVKNVPYSISVPAVGYSLERGELIKRENNYQLIE